MYTKFKILITYYWHVIGVDAGVLYSDCLRSFSQGVSKEDVSDPFERSGSAWLTVLYNTTLRCHDFPSGTGILAGTRAASRTMQTMER